MVNIFKSTNAKFVFWMSLLVISILSMVISASLLEIFYKTASLPTLIILGIYALLSPIGFYISLINTLDKP